MTPRKAYDDQRRHAESRGISWEFSYEDWLEMWLISGKWHERGRESGQYCMCRYGDVGPYSYKNCYIDLTDNNQQNRWVDARKILPEQYINIVQMYLLTDMTQAEVALEFGVDQSYVSKILSKYKKATKNEQLSAL